MPDDHGSPELPDSWKPGHLHGQRHTHFDAEFPINIVGEASYQPALELICGPKDDLGVERRIRAFLYREDDNPYDANAIRVEIEGKIVGYLSRTDAVRYRRLAGPTEIDALILGGWDRGPDDVGNYGVKLGLTLG